MVVNKARNDKSKQKVCRTIWKSVHSPSVEWQEQEKEHAEGSKRRKTYIVEEGSWFAKSSCIEGEIGQQSILFDCWRLIMDIHIVKIASRESS